MNAEHIDSTSALFPPTARSILAEGNMVRFCARGSSMSPFIRDGDYLVIEPAAAESLRAGDVVLCEGAPGRIIAHRLQHRISTPGGLRLVLCGDNQIEHDTVSPDQVIGRVLTTQRGSRTYRPGTWPNRLIALAATGCRRKWRVLRSKVVRGRQVHA